MIRPPGRAHIAARTLGLASLLGLVAIWMVFAFLGDRAWWSVAIIYGPRWLFALVWVGMLPWLVVEFRRALLPALLGLVLGVFGIIDFRVGMHRASQGTGAAYRVMELNAEGGNGSPSSVGAILQEVRRERPDLLVIVECSHRIGIEVGAMTGYATRTNAGSSICLFSRDTIVAWVPARTQEIVRATVSTSSGQLTVGLVHLPTPRTALDTYFDPHGWSTRGPVTRENLRIRDAWSAQAQQWIEGQTGPTIVAGDFNLPVESAIYRRYWSNLRNAFERAGMGPGYTKETRLWGVRIDHILTSADIGTRSSFVGADVGSDHRPLIADLVLPPAQRTMINR